MFSIVIPDAGLGRRLASGLPKALLRVGDETLIARQLRIIKDTFPLSDIVITLGYEAEKVRRILPPEVKIVVNTRYSETNVSRSIALGMTRCHYKTVLVVYGDLVFSEEALRPFIGLRESSILVDSNGTLARDEVGVNIIDSYAQFFCYSLPVKWSQVVMLTTKDRNLFQNLANEKVKRKLFGYEILNMLLEEERPIRSLCLPKANWVVEVDTLHDLKMAKELVGH